MPSPGPENTITLRSPREKNAKRSTSFFNINGVRQYFENAVIGRRAKKASLPSKKRKCRHYLKVPSNLTVFIFTFAKEMLS